MPGTLMRARRVLLLNNTAVSERRERRRMRGIEKRKRNREGVSLQRNVTQPLVNLGKRGSFSLTSKDMQTFFMST